MKFSESILLGSLTIKPCRFLVLNDSTTAGCAIGMAAIAEGFKPSNQLSDERIQKQAWRMIMRHHPWLLKKADIPPECECDLTTIGFGAEGPKPPNYVTIIMHLFDHHVCGSRYSAGGKWTVERLADYVRSVEPKEEEVKEEVTNEVQRCCTVR